MDDTADYEVEDAAPLQDEGDSTTVESQPENQVLVDPIERPASTEKKPSPPSSSSSRHKDNRRRRNSPIRLPNRNRSPLARRNYPRDYRRHSPPRRPLPPWRHSLPPPRRHSPPHREFHDRSERHRHAKRSRSPPTQPPPPRKSSPPRHRKRRSEKRKKTFRPSLGPNANDLDVEEEEEEQRNEKEEPEEPEEGQVVQPTSPKDTLNRFKVEPSLGTALTLMVNQLVAMNNKKEVDDLRAQRERNDELHQILKARSAFNKKEYQRQREQYLADEKRKQIESYARIITAVKSSTENVD